MSVTLNLESSPSVSPSVSGFGPHIEELHAFFKTRGVRFGSVEDLKPFMERIDTDSGFRDEIASMVRAIIYRERDGLSPLELIELLETAVGGPTVEDAEAPEVREAARQLMAFVEGVFKSRRNPGAVSVSTEPEPERMEKEAAVAPATRAGELVESAVPDMASSAPAEHSTADVFYRARLVAEEEGTERREPVTLVEERVPKDNAAKSEDVLLHREEHWHVPFENFGDRGGERSRTGVWVVGICALLLAFCAGLFVHQRLIVPLRDANTPYEGKRDPWPVPQVPSAAGGAQQAAAAPQSAATHAADPALVAADGASNGPVENGASAKPIAAELPVADVTERPKYMAPATVGASRAVMDARLVYAPPPSYPMMAEMTRTQGKVTVEAVVGKSGRVIRAQAVSGHHLLRGAAVRAVLARRYRPYTVNDRPANVATLVTVNFSLKR